MTDTAETTTTPTLTHSRYPAYKDSGVDWLGEIPAHWEVKRLKFIAAFRSGEGITGETINASGTYRVFGGNGLRGYTEKYTHSGNYILIGRQGALCGNINYAEGEFWASEHAVVVFIKDDSCHFWLGEALRTMNLNQYSVAAAQPGLSIERIQQLYLAYPPLAEQTRIAKFLDRKTAQIDQAIAQKERLIELLNERRQVMIHRSVTRGLNPNAPMKDSGIDWIGEIPEHWESLKVKNIFRLIVEPAPINNDFELLSVYTDIGVKPRKELEERGNKASTTDGYWLVKKGDIIVNKLLAWMGAIGLSNYDGVTSPAYDILRPQRPISGEYYHTLFRSPICSSELKRHSRGIMDMRLRLYFDKFGDILVPYPPVGEQLKITEQLNQIDSEINEAKRLLDSQIQKLQELKSTLINSAVTGKIKV